LIDVIQPISSEQLTTIVDHETSDKDCRSIQSILSHVVESGYTYAIEIRKWLGEDVSYQKKEKFAEIEKYTAALIQMFQYNEKLFEDHPKIKLEIKNPEKKILVRWGQRFDADQLMEHAIVHILRHRRQIERFMIKLKS